MYGYAVGIQDEGTGRHVESIENIDEKTSGNEYFVTSFNGGVRYLHLFPSCWQEGAVNGMHGLMARSLLRYQWRHSLPCQEAVRSRSCGINYVSGTMAEAPLYFKLRWH